MKKLTVLIICSSILNIVAAQKIEKTIVLTPFTENTLNKNGILRGFTDATLFTLNNLNKYKCKYISAFVRGIEPYNYSEESKNPYFELGLGPEKLKISVSSFHKYILVCIVNSEYIKLTSQWIEKDLETNEYFFENQKYIISLKKNHEMRVTRKLDSKTIKYELIEAQMDEDCN
jgi:hypothetical protein